MKSNLWVTVTLCIWISGCGGGGGGGGGGGKQSSNTAPIVSNQAFAVTEDTPFTGHLALSPTPGVTTVSIRVTTNPTKGAVSIDSGTWSITYTPQNNSNGTDTAAIEVSDSAGKSGSATITFNIAPSNDPPTAHGSVASFASPANVVLTADMQDIDGDALTVVLDAVGLGTDTKNPAVGTATINGNKISLALPSTFKGVTRVKYRARDPQGALSDPAFAVAYVGVAPFKAWYAIGSLDNGERNVWATDFTETPTKVTNFQPPSLASGLTLSGNRQIAVVREVQNSKVVALWASNTHAPYNVRLVSGSSLDLSTIDRIAVSDDGSKVAFAGTKTGGQKAMWIASTVTAGVPQEIALPMGDYPFRDAPMQFNKQGSALYFVSHNDGNGSQYFYRVAASDPGHPQHLVPNGNEFAYVLNYVIAPDDSYALVHAQIVNPFEIYYVSIADPTQRRAVNADLGSDSANAMIANADATKIAFQTSGTDPVSWTDDRIFVSDVMGPRNSTLVLDTDATRTGPLNLVQFRPDNNALLFQPWTKVGASYQVDLAEMLLSPLDHQPHPINPAEPAGTRSIVNGNYDLTGDSVIYSDNRDGGPWTLFEGHRDAFASPIVLGAPGVSSNPNYSPDMSVIAIDHSANVPDDAKTYGRLINRSAPDSMITFTEGAYPPIYVTVSGLIED